MKIRNIKCMVFIIAAVVVGLSNADDRTNATHLAHAADATTTVVGIAAVGAAELNPLALPMLPVSIYLTERERGKCSQLQAAFQSGRWGFATANLATIVGLFPFSLVAMPVTASIVWKREQEKIRECKVAVLMEVFRNENLWNNEAREE